MDNVPNVHIYTFVSAEILFQGDFSLWVSLKKQLFKRFSTKKCSAENFLYPCLKFLKYPSFVKLNAIKIKCNEIYFKYI